MKSDVYKVNAGTDREKLLDAVERMGRFEGLSEAQARRLRLLSVEMLELVGHLLDRLDCEFWLQSEGACFALHLTAHAPVTLEQRDELVQLSTGKRNEATRGVLGKIGGVFESFVMSENELPYGGMLDADAMAMGDMGAYSQMWSLAAYQALPAEKRREDWDDGPDKSAMAAMADEVTVGVTSDKVEMVVSVGFGTGKAAAGG